MASYTAIASGDLDPEAPWKTSTAHALNDNVEGAMAGLASFKLLTAGLDQTASSEAVTNATIRDNAVSANKINFAAHTFGSQSISGLSTWDIPVGLYTIITDAADLTVDQYHATTGWVSEPVAKHILVMSDGNNQRVSNNDVGSQTIYFNRLSS